MNIGVLAHPLRPLTGPIATHIAASLRQHNIQTWVYSEWQDDDVREDVRHADMVVAIGGDGAMLRAARVCAAYAVPVLGINMGQLGFLTEISGPKDWDTTLERVLAGDYWIEERMMVHGSVLRPTTTDGAYRELCSGDALNEVVISGATVGRTVQLEAYIDGDWATSYRADALVVATSTGSTAYALACGGPILPPGLRNILVVPAAAHLSMDRPIVLSEGSMVEVRATPDTHSDLLLTLDGVALMSLEMHDRVQVQASERASRFVRMRERNYFYRSLLDRLEPRVSRSEPNDGD